MAKLAQTSYPIHDLLQRRWSPRAFSQKPVDTQTLTRLFEAARWAPSWRNQQPWYFIIATKDNPDEHRRLFDCLTPANQRWAGHAPVLIVAVAKRCFDHNDQPNPTALYDTGQAVAHLSLEAMAHNLYVHQMGGVSLDRVREIYAIPEAYQPVVALAIGYLGQAEMLPEDLREREMAGRTRRPLSQTVFQGTWEQSAELASIGES